MTTSYTHDTAFSRCRRWALILWLSVFPAATLLVYGAEHAELPIEIVDQSWRMHDLLRGTVLAEADIADFDFDTDGVAWLATSQGVYRYDGYRLEPFAAHEELPGEQVNAIGVTATGSIWLGLERGLARFDGKTLEHVKTGEGKPPAVGHIRVDDSGQPWFCTEDGLCTYGDDGWQEYLTGENLPSFAVDRCYRDSRGRVFALTTRGLGQWRENRWEYPWTESGLPGVDVACTAIAESPSHGLMVTTEGRWVFIEKDGRWSRVRLPEPVQGPLCTTRDGAILTPIVGDESLWISRWTGTGFERASAVAASDRPVTVTVIREAPDGSVWYGGVGCLQRWERRSRSWTEFRDAPPPRFVDGEGGVWCFDDRRAAIYDSVADQWALPGSVDVTAAAIFTVSPSGTVTAIVWSELTAETGIQYVHDYTWTAQGNLVVCGTDAMSHVLEATLRETEWTVRPVAELQGADVIRCAADPNDGVWYLTRTFLSEKWGHFLQLTRVRGTEADVFHSAYPALSLWFGPFPEIGVTYEGVAWAYGRSDGAVRLDPMTGETWSLPEELLGRSIAWAEGKGAVWLGIGRTESEPGFIGHYKDGEWKLWSADMDRDVSATRLRDGRVLIGGHDGYYVVDESIDRAPVFCKLPRRGTIARVVEDADGTLWMWVTHALDGESLLRYRSDGTPPETIIQADPAELGPDDTFTARILCAELFAPLESWRSPGFSWRLDGEEWSRFGETSKIQFEYADLRPGWHTLEAVARDQDLDLDPTPARYAFYVLHLPLQQQGWFLPVVSSVLVVVLVLAITALVSRFQLAHYAENLEGMVETRTTALRRTEQHILGISEREQQRIGHDLHDDVLQDLTAIAMSGEFLAKRLAHESPSGVDELQEIVDLIDQTSEKTRRLAKGLAPVNIDKLGLVGSLQDLAAASNLHGVSCRVESARSAVIVDDGIRRQLYRIAQEAVNNALKHAKAKGIIIRLLGGDSYVELIVKDNGKGLPESLSKSEGMGMQIMRYRADTIQGTLDFTSKPGEGTTVTCRVPKTAMD